VRVGQAGEQRSTGEINSASSVKFLRLIVRTDENVSIFFDRDCFGLRSFFVNRVNISVNEQKIDIIRSADGQVRFAEKN